MFLVVVGAAAAELAGSVEQRAKVGGYLQLPVQRLLELIGQKVQPVTDRERPIHDHPLPSLHQTAAAAHAVAEVPGQLLAADLDAAPFRKAPKLTEQALLPGSLPGCLSGHGFMLSFFPEPPKGPGADFRSHGEFRPRSVPPGTAARLGGIAAGLYSIGPHTVRFNRHRLAASETPASAQPAASRDLVRRETTAMEKEYTAVVKQEGDWWLGWIEEVPGVNCQERTHEELMDTLAVTLREALELNRQDALEAAGSDFREETPRRRKETLNNYPRSS